MAREQEVRRGMGRAERRQLDRTNENARELNDLSGRFRYMPNYELSAIPANAATNLLFGGGRIVKDMFAYKSGWVVGFSYVLTGAAAGEDLNVEIRTRTAVVLHTSVITTTATNNAIIGEIAPEEISFLKDENLYVTCNTSASWTATAVGINAYLIIEM